MDERIKLYLKRINDMLEHDPLYKKLNKSIDHGKNSYKIVQRKSVKVVDHDWIEFIEDVLPNLDTIVRNPRKFIVVEEDIIDISLAKSITKESVKHLATHTNFISAVEGDKVIPSKILNVQKEESYEIYENRFLFTLLTKLREFVQKRYDLIKKSLVDSDQTQIVLESKYKIDQAQLKLRLDTIANMGFEEVNKLHTEDLTDYERVARMQNIVNGFMSSAFAKEMKSSSPVRPPIMHTNVIKKDPNFKKALKLWDFIFSYNNPGYHIEYINEETPVKREIDPNFKAIMYLNHLVVTNLFKEGHEQDLQFKENHDHVMEDAGFDPKVLDEIMCVTELELYILKREKDLKQLVKDEKAKIDKYREEVKKKANVTTVKVLGGYVLTNKFKEIEKKILTEYHKILSSLTPSDYKPYSIKEVNDEYLTRLKDIIFKAFTEINNYNFANEENN